MVEGGQLELAVESCSGYSAGGDKCGDVRNHDEPPKTLSDEIQGPTGAWMAGQSRGMCPFQDRGTGRVRDKQLLSRTPQEQALYTPDECSR